MYSPELRAANALTEKGRKAKETGDMAKAEKAFTKAVKKMPYHPVREMMYSSRLGV
jgi:hypothetical protein